MHGAVSDYFFAQMSLLNHTFKQKLMYTVISGF